MMSARRCRSTASGAMSPAPAIPARTASRSPCRRDDAASSGARSARRSGGQADRPRRARFAAARGGPVPLRPRHRHHDLAGRGGPDLVDPEAPPRGGRLPGRRAHPARDRGRRRRACASASSREGRAPAREGAVIATPDGREVGTVTSGGFGPTRQRAGRHGLRRAGRVRARHQICISSCAASRCRRKVAADAVRSAPLQAHEQLEEGIDHDHALHQGPRIHPRRRRHRHRRHHRLRPEPARRRRLRRAARASARRSPKGGEAAVVESVKAASEVYAPVSGEVVEVNARSRSRPGAVNEDPAGRGWFIKIKLADRASSTASWTEEQYQEFVKSIS